MKSSTSDLTNRTAVESRRFRSRAFLAAMFLALLFPHVRSASPLVAGPRTSQVSVVDIMPESLSGETWQDMEPTLAVNPANPSEIAASAITWEPMGAPKAPIFVSTNGGKTWSCRSIVPKTKIPIDVTLRFGGSLGRLFLAMLLYPAGNELCVCRIESFDKSRWMDILEDRCGAGIDEPCIAATTSGLTDRVFVGNNDFNGPSGQTATIDRSLDAAGDPPARNFQSIRLESRSTFGRDGAEIRPAISADGNVVYAVFNRVTSQSSNEILRTGDVVLVRDDNGGNSTRPFTALVDPADKRPGLRVIKKRTFGWDQCLGGDRLSGDLAIAVHPKDAGVIYLVWSEQVNDQPTLHVMKSEKAGAKWSPVLRTVNNAKNPGLAISAKGTVGFLYQQVVGDTWLTQFERTTNDFETAPNVLTLARFPVSEFAPPTPCYRNLFLGDYLQLMSVGDDFYGIFPSSNFPDLSRFPWGVTFQRRADFKQKKLLDPDGNEVDCSIDPFFFKVTE
jgi:hypothetical protein